MFPNQNNFVNRFKKLKEKNKGTLFFN